MAQAQSRLTVRVEKDVYEQLKLISDERDMTMNALVNEALAHYLPQASEALAHDLAARLTKVREHISKQEARDRSIVMFVAREAMVTPDLDPAEGTVITQIKDEP